MSLHQVQYMVDFTMPQNIPDEFSGLIPQQRATVNQLFNDGKLLNYTLSLEAGKLWAVFSVNDERELYQLVHRLPLTRYMKMQVCELTFYHTSLPVSTSFSMN